MLIGARTNKLLFLGIRNKYCSVCASAAKVNQEPRKHVCYKNYSGSSGGMEQDIIVEGFRKSEEMHGLRYLGYIGDGDSSVYARIREKVSYGWKVKKHECKNHAIRCYTSNLHALGLLTTYSPESRRVLRSYIPRLVKAAKCAIDQSQYTREGIQILREDLGNGPRHVLGDHTKCRDTYCTRKDAGERDWTADIGFQSIFKAILNKVDYLVKKGDRLAFKATTNRCENFNSVANVAFGAKRKNLYQRGSFRRRAIISALRVTQGRRWAISWYKKRYGYSPGDMLKKICAVREGKKCRRALSYTASRASGKTSRRKRYGGDANCKDYGPDADDTPDKTEDEMKILKKDFLNALKIKFETQEKISAIESQTIDQYADPNYRTAKRGLLTSSEFGPICRRRKNTSCHNKVKSLLNPTLIDTPAIRFGRLNEPVAIQKFQDLKPELNIRRCGLFGSRKWCYLGATPDSVIGTDGVIEVKCLESVKDRKLIDVAQDADPEVRQKLCLGLVNNELKLKKMHRYYYQVQGQMHITERNYCYFVVYTKQDFHYELIERDDEFWETEMLPHLEKFYMGCILPELVDSRIMRGRQCRDPQYIVDEQNKLVKRTKKTNKIKAT